jgi:hypothetical protein
VIEHALLPPSLLFSPALSRIFLPFAAIWTVAQKRDQSDREALKTYFIRFNAEINRALLFVREINSEEWHDRLLGNGEDEYDLIRFIDKHVHPTYLRLIEGVLTPLARPVAYFSRLDRGKGTDGLNVWSVVQELEGGPAESLVRSYRHIIRNGIAHGGITFVQDEVRYRDNENEETFRTKAVVSLLDDLLDTCNGVVAGLKVFLLVARDRGYIPPRELLLEELQEETCTPWWRIEGCVESEVAGRSQLIVYARPDSRDYSKVRWSTIQSGILAEFFAPGYER